MQNASFLFLQQLARRESLTLSVRGDCMRPGIARGASIEVRRKALYFPGDVIVFRTSSGDLAVHRFFGYAPTGSGLRILTRGDHCEERDTAVRPGAIIGVVCGHRVPAAMRLRALAAVAMIAVRKLLR